MNKKKTTVNKNHIFIFLFLLTFNIIILIFRNSAVVTSIEKIGLEISSSIVNPFNIIIDSINLFTNSVHKLQELQIEYEHLLNRFAENESIIENYNTIIQNNRVLEEALNFSESIHYQNIPVRVIGKSPEFLHENWIVNKGIRQGIQENFPVVAYQDGLVGLVGKVHEVSWNSAVIRPILDPQSFIAGRLSRTRFEGLIQGQGSSSGQLIMEYLNRNARNQISVGDEVITSGLDSLYPSDILVGEVTEISADLYTSSLTLGISAFIDFARLEYVFILSDNMN